MFGFLSKNKGIDDTVKSNLPIESPNKDIVLEKEVRTVKSSRTNAVQNIAAKVVVDINRIFNKFYKFLEFAKMNHSTMVNAVNSFNVIDKKMEDCAHLLVGITEMDRQRGIGVSLSLEKFTEGVLGLEKQTDACDRRLISALERFSDLTEKASRQIEQMNNISDQVKLISLNARIEAARAGEAGKGFAVVAEEIQKLSKQSELYTKEFEETIKQITAYSLENRNILEENITGYHNGCEHMRETISVVKGKIGSGSTRFIEQYDKLSASLKEISAQTAEIKNTLSNTVNNIQLVEESDFHKSEDQLIADIKKISTLLGNED